MSITVHDLHLQRGAKTVLHLDDWQLPQGTRGLLTGPSGSGKTTLLFALGGLLAPAGGAITVNGTALHTLKAGAIDRWRGRHVGFVFQEMHIIPHLSVLNNIMLAARFTGRAVDAAWLADILDMLRLVPLQTRYGHQLSTGEKQRVAIARAIAHRPALLLADEPTSGLDDRNAEAVMALLQMAADATRATLLLATHDGRLKHLMPVCLNLGEVA